MAAVALLAIALAGAYLWFVELPGPSAPLPQPDAVYAADAPKGPFRAGAAKVDITPPVGCYLAGFGQGRRSEGVHDPLYARALAVERGDLRVAIVALDLIGLMQPDVAAIKAQCADRSGIPAEHIILHSTHNHAGPDTLGFWGQAFVFSGKDDEYMRTLAEKTAEAVASAARALAPARMRLMSARVPETGIARNERDPGLLDRKVTILAFERAGLPRHTWTGATPIATVVHFGMHPEALWSKNRLVTADFPATVCRNVETGLEGGVAIFLNGTLGGMVTVDFRNGEKGTFECAERVGKAIADLALKRLRDDQVECSEIMGLVVSPPPVHDMLLAVRRAQVLLPCHNRFMNLFQLIGRIDRPTFGGDYHFETEVAVFQFGPVRIGAVPGEILPEPGLAAQRALGVPYAVIVSCADEELGYLISRARYDEPLYSYERGWCVGPYAADLLVERLGRLAASLESAHPPE